MDTALMERRLEVLAVAALVENEAVDNGHDITSPWIDDEVGVGVHTCCRLCGLPITVEWAGEAVSVAGINMAACRSTGFHT